MFLVLGVHGLFLSTAFCIFNTCTIFSYGEHRLDPVETVRGFLKCILIDYYFFFVVKRFAKLKMCSTNVLCLLDIVHRGELSHYE